VVTFYGIASCKAGEVDEWRADSQEASSAGFHTLFSVLGDNALGKRLVEESSTSAMELRLAPRA
jgi:hypothetical protein